MIRHSVSGGLCVHPPGHRPRKVNRPGGLHCFCTGCLARPTCASNLPKGVVGAWYFLAVCRRFLNSERDSRGLWYGSDLLVQYQKLDIDTTVGDQAPSPAWKKGED